ncbi:MAG TPA: IS1380 family transposase [Candidatus Acidoferrum sp.]|nr:IS1380 family transposase [Candidatus Acidoferrum sp.]
MNTQSSQAPEQNDWQEFKPLFGGGKIKICDTLRAVTPFGGLSVFIEFLGRVGLVEQLASQAPYQPKSGNHYDPGQILVGFVLSVIAGAQRFAHTNQLRADRALHALLGMKRFPSDDTILNYFRRFSQAEVERFWRPMWRWLISRLPQLEKGFSLDLDSTIFSRHGAQQQGAARGYNPRRPGRLSHHPLLAVLAEANFVLHSWLRSGNAGASQGAAQFLNEALSLLGDQHWIRCVRADSGFYGDHFLSFLEERALPYIVVARLTSYLKSRLYQVSQWQAIDKIYCVAEFHFKLWNWKTERRFVVVREEVQTNKAAVGRKLLDLPGYVFRVFVTNRHDSPLEIWRDYNGRATVECRIDELKNELAADHFCLRSFFATESAFLAVVFGFNLLGEFQRAVDPTLKTYKQPATLRFEVFTCGAILGRSGHHLILHMSNNWGGYSSRKPLFNSLLHWPPPTSPKFDPQ